MNPKVTSEHLGRGAIVYVRQSTIGQVVEHTESQRRQYALRVRAPNAEEIAVRRDQCAAVVVEHLAHRSEFGATRVVALRAERKLSVISWPHRGLGLRFSGRFGDFPEKRPRPRPYFHAPSVR